MEKPLSRVPYSIVRSCVDTLRDGMDRSSIRDPAVRIQGGSSGDGRRDLLLDAAREQQVRIEADIQRTRELLLQLMNDLECIRPDCWLEDFSSRGPDCVKESPTSIAERFARNIFVGPEVTIQQVAMTAGIQSLDAPEVALVESVTERLLKASGFSSQPNMFRVCATFTRRDVPLIMIAIFLCSLDSSSSPSVLDGSVANTNANTGDTHHSVMLDVASELCWGEVCEVMHVHQHAYRDDSVVHVIGGPEDFQLMR